MMDDIRKRGAAIADARVHRRKSEIKSALQSEIAHDTKIVETDDGVSVQSRCLGQKLIDNSSLRDVAFLMRGVR